jgi:ABC-type nitrate/sulfonate/bicarbonate transport system substrate-binding protein
LSALAVVITGYGGAAPAQTPAGQAVPDAKLTAVNFGLTGLTAVNWSLMVGIKLNFFRNRGVDFRLVTAQNAPDNIRALIVGGIQFVSSAPDSVILPNASGADLIAVAGETNHVLFRLIAAKGIAAVKDLRDKSIAVSRLNGPDASMVEQLLEQAGIRKGQYTFLAAGGTSQRLAAVQSGGVAATLLAPPGDAQALKAGLTDLGLTGGKVKPLQFTVLIADRKWAEANTGIVVQTIRGLQDALKWLKDPVNRDAAIKILSEYNKLSEDLAAHSYKVYVSDQFVFSSRGEFNMEGIRNVVDNLIKSGALKQPPPISRYFPTNFVEQASR